MDYREYLKKIPKNGEWGDHITPQAAADLVSMILPHLIILPICRTCMYILGVPMQCI